MDQEETILFSKNHSVMKEILEFSRQLSDISAAAAVLAWDRETYMPDGSSNSRANQLATLVGIGHRLLTSSETGRLLEKAAVLQQSGVLTRYDSALIRELNRAFYRAVRVPSKLAEDLERTTSEGTEIWQKARRESNFKIFRDALQRIIDLKLEEADKVGYKDTPYNLFLDDFEPGLTVNAVDIIFAELKKMTAEIMDKIKNSDVRIDQDILKADLPLREFTAFTEDILRVMGFDFNFGRQDVSAHPMTTSFDPTDVRVTTRFGEQLFTSTIYSSIHEGGHALYEQGIDRALSRTLLANGVSLGIHESQSRFWENFIGRSLVFWQFLYGRLAEAFPEVASKASPEDFFRAVNKVEPNLIRVDSDEITYNLHIILRYEIERDLLEGRISVDDLPEVWNVKVKQYLGLDVPNDASGVLQDVHWSDGNFGYFPTYSLGNLYAAQLYYTLAREMGNVELAQCSNLVLVREWLREKIHRHGSVFPADELIKMATGNSLNPEYFGRYLNYKFGLIYQF